MNIALLNTRIQIQKNKVAVDEIGNHLSIWEDYFSCAATLGGESGAEKQTAGLTVEDTDCSFTVRYCRETAGITSSGYRILFNDEIFDIIRVDHQNLKHKSLKLFCRKVRR